MNLIEELYALQEKHGWLREEDLHALSDRIHVPLYEIQGVSSFYPHFRRSPPPKLHVAACRDLSCHMADGGSALGKLKGYCAGKKDVEFHEVSCLGRCDSAPACAVNDEPMSVAQAEQCVKSMQPLPPADRPAVVGRQQASPSPSPRKWRCDPGEPYGVLKAIRKSKDIDGMIERIKKSGLRGMGGAGFPTGVKWELVRKEKATPKYVVCNADESEPGTFKDRVILEELPHLVIEGIALGALAVGAKEAWIYIRHEYARERRAIERALKTAPLDGLDLNVFVSPGGYILGEETALLEALEGKRGEPRNKPPYPGSQGLHGKPTLMNNVETFALVPRIVKTGEHRYKFFSVSGDVAKPGVHEVEIGATLRQLLDLCGGVRGKLQAFLPGGASTGFLPADKIDIVMDWKPLQEAGSALGSGAVVVVNDTRDMLALARNLTAFFRNESCGKCVPCRVGTEKAVILIDGKKREDLALLPELNETLQQTSICGLGQAALLPVLSVLQRFRK